MRPVRLALLGLWWRWPASLTVLLVALAATAVAAAGPTYQAGAREAVLQTSLRSAPVGSDGTGVEITQSGGSRAQTILLAQAVKQAFHGVDAYGAPVLSIASDRIVPDPDGRPRATLPVVYRQDSCRRVRILAGACVSEDDPVGMDITSATAARMKWAVGSTIPLKNITFRAGKVDLPTLRVRGIYDPVAPADPYWFADTHQYFGQVSRFAAASVPRVDAALVPAAAWAGATVLPEDVVSIGADLALDPDRVHLRDLHALEQSIDAATHEVQILGGTRNGVPAEVSTTLAAVLFTAQQNGASVNVPIFVIAVQLLVLAWIVLYLVLLSSAESRSAEIALGKLRGLTPRQTMLHALLEPLLLLVLAVPLGTVLAYAVLRTTAGPSVLGPHVTIGLPAAAWGAAAVAGLGGVVAAGLAGSAVLRRSVLDQWRRTDRRARRASWVVEAAVVVAAVAGLVDLLSSPPGTGASGGAGFLAALAPGLLATTCALVGARLLPFVGVAGLRATRGSRFVAVFVAVRQVARRRGDLRVFSLLTVAVALVVFGVASRSVFEANRLERARIDVGADRVVSIAQTAQPDAAAVVARVDPGGTQAVAVYDGPLLIDAQPDVFVRHATSTPPTVLVADPARFAAVAYWRNDFGAGTLAAALRPLARAPASPPGFTGTRLGLTAQVKITAGLGVDVHAALTDATGAPIDLDLGAVGVAPITAPPATVRWTADVPACAQGCLFRRLSIVPSVNDDQVPVSQIRVVAADSGSGGGSSSTSFLPRLLTAQWTPLNSTSTGGTTESVSTTGGALTVRVPAGVFPQSLEQGYGALAGVPGVVPALVTPSQFPGDGSAVIPAQLGPDGDDLIMQATATHLLPHAGDAGALVSRAWLVAGRPNGYDQYAPNEVWLAAGAPADFPARLAAAGLPVRGVQSVSDRSLALARQGPTFAVAMLVAGAGAAAALAVGGATAMFFVASRRRLYELAALRTLGLPPRRLLGSLVLEQFLVGLLASAAGLAAGIVGTRLALARLPEFADRPSFPPLDLDLPVLLVLSIGVVITLVMAGAAAAGGLVLIRRATPQRLREVQG